MKHLSQPPTPTRTVERPPRASGLCRSLTACLALASTACLLTTASAPAQDTRPPDPAGLGSAGWGCDPSYQTGDGLTCAPVVIPDNAYATAGLYDRGWHCRYGFRRDNAACIAVTAPGNAHLVASGTRWQCDRGYSRAGPACEAIQLPDFAYLTDTGFGSGWDCERGYTEHAGTCQRVTVPENGFLTSSGYGAGWDCLRGYRQMRLHCEPVTVPAGAHLNDAGNGWVCDHPSRNADGTCQSD